MPRIINPDRSAVHDYTITEQLPTQIFVRNTAERDAKWVHDQIPGMRGLRAVFSQIRQISK
jgi:hypothetical protein